MRNLLVYFTANQAVDKHTTRTLKPLIAVLHSHIHALSCLPQVPGLRERMGLRADILNLLYR